MKEPKKKSNTPKLEDSDKTGTSKDSSILGKLGLLMEKENKSEHNLDDFIDKTTSDKKSKKQPINKSKEQKTRLIPQHSSTPLSSKEISNQQIEEHPSTHSSSLFKDLQQWDESEQKISIKSGQTIRGTYRLDFKIGSGGMGTVWQALDLIQDEADSKDKYVAIKFINHEIRNHPYALKALVREFGRYKKLIHPNIVRAYELNRDGNEVFIVMELLKGNSLKEFIEEHPEGISLLQAQPIIKGMCDALEHAHNEGIVHLDFKPGNVFYSPLAQLCKVIDFGIARLTSRQARDETRFDPGTLGAITTAYASNEMLMEAEPDPRDDIYGLACIVYELLSGHHPFNKNLSIKAERENMRPDQVSGLKKDEFRGLLHGLSFRRDNRTASATQFYEELFSSQKQTNNKYIKWSAIAFASLFIPFVLYKGFTSWQLNQVSTDIQKQSNSALDGFVSLSFDEQKNILNSPSLRMALVEHIVSKKGSAENALKQIGSFDPKIQQRLFTDKNIRVFLITHYSDKIDQDIKNDEFQSAKKTFLNVLDQYPDSMQLTKKFNKIISQKGKRLETVKQQYQQCLEDHSKQLTELFPCLQQTRAILHKIDNADIILTSFDLTKRYNAEISSAINISNISLAKSLLANWHTLEKREINRRTHLEKQLIREANNQKQISNFSTSNDTQTIPNRISNESPRLDDSNQFIKQLLNQAEQQHATKQLMTPVDDNAWQTYQKILNQDPGNEQALSGINKITKTYVLWAKEEIKRNNIKHAGYLFNQALKVDPDDNEALSGIAQLSMKNFESLQQEELAVEVLPSTKFLNQPSSEIAKLLNKAEQQITKKQLMAPAKANAWKTYNEILALDPRNKQAQVGINKISTIYIQRARKKLERGNIKHAGYLFNKALVVSPGNKDALSGLDHLDKLNE